MAKTLWSNRGHLYAPHVTPVIVDCNFQVKVADTNGLGILAKSLKGQGVTDIFMHTSATPGKGNSGLTNPNPQSGIVLVKLADNYSRLFGMKVSMQNPNSGSNVVVTAAGAALTVGNIYTISVLGTTTAADWLALGVPLGVTPAVGVSFVAIATGAGVGSGQVQVPAAAGCGVHSFELIGDPNQMINPVPVGKSSTVGGWLAFGCYADSAADAPVLAAPADGSVIRVEMYLSQSSVMVAGE